MSGTRLIVNSLSADGPAAAAEIARRLGMLPRTVSVYVRRLRDAGAIHVAGWKGAQRPVYAAGEGVDKRRPAPRTVAQWNKRAHRAIKADPVKALDKTMRDRTYKARTRTKRPPPQSWLSSLV